MLKAYLLNQDFKKMYYIFIQESSISLTLKFEVPEK